MRKTFTIERLRNELSQFIERGLVSISVQDDYTIVIVQSRSEFKSNAEQRIVKKILKDYEFSFNGTGVHMKKNVTFQKEGLVTLSEINKNIWSTSIFMTMWKERHTDHNGMVDANQIIEHMKDLMQTCIDDIEKLKSLQN